MSHRGFSPNRRAKITVGLSLVLVAALAAMLLDADRRRAARAAESATHRAVVSAIGLPDLALSSSARWLRHPSQAEAGAALADAPASLDTDPAGALLGPPRAVLSVGGVDVVVRRGRGAAP